MDATPYIEQNLALQDYIAYMRDRNAHLEKRLAGNDDGKTVYPKTATAVSTPSVPDFR